MATTQELMTAKKQAFLSQYTVYLGIGSDHKRPVPQTQRIVILTKI